MLVGYLYGSKWESNLQTGKLDYVYLCMYLYGSSRI
jgi:hypothetical protein